MSVPNDPRYLPLTAAIWLHCAEEFPRFPQWASRHFGGTTTHRFFLASHAVLLLPAVTTAGILPWRAPRSRLGNWLAAATAAGFVGNSVFHLATTIRWREYSPGVFTAVTIVSPSALATLRLARSRGLRGRSFVAAAVTGTLLNSLAVASLNLDMPTLGGRVPEQRT